jgi:hypothetical protein
MKYKIGDIFRYMDEYYEIEYITDGYVFNKKCIGADRFCDGNALFDSWIKSGSYTLIHFETEEDRFLFRLKEGI